MTTTLEEIARDIKQVTESNAPEFVKRASIESIKAGNEYAVWRVAHLHVPCEHPRVRRYMVGSTEACGDCGQGTASRAPRAARG